MQAGKKIIINNTFFVQIYMIIFIFLFKLNFKNKKGIIMHFHLQRVCNKIVILIVIL